jgi:hypothetical protein
VLDKAKWIELGGLIAVVFSLLFVGLELRQNTAALSAQAILELNLAINQEFQGTSRDASMAEIMVKSANGIDDLNDVELERLKYAWYESFNTMEAAFLFYRKGILSEEDYATYLRAACESIVLPGVQQLIETGDLYLNVEYQSHLKQCVSGD